MKTRNLLFYFNLLLFVLVAETTLAQRPMEKLGRGVVAQKVSNGVYVNWRITSDEWYNTYYKVYRDGTLIYTTTAKEASNYLDPSGTASSKYSVSRVKNGVESSQSNQVSVLTKGYLEIPMRNLKSLGKTEYYLNDATAADLDGDGEYEVIIKRMNRDWSTTNTNYTYFEAYKMDGTFMWAIDVGPNITMDVEINIAAFDFDGDGKAEVFMRSSDNTIFGLDVNNQNGTSVGDRDGDGVTNYRYSIGGDGFINAGPEYLSLINGVTGKELDWVNFIPRGNTSDWGDDYGHRANKFFFGAPYLDGKKPSLFIGRGIYTMTKMQTYDVVNKKLVKKWYWECTSPTAKQQGKYDAYPKSYFGQGYHNYTIADVDNDGCDEVNWGSMTIDQDGKPLYSTELGHGDAQHYGDFDPYRKGQEAFACNETNPGTNLRDAKTGQILYRHITPSDCGRCCVANISDTYKGAEAWGGNVGISCTDRAEMTHFGVAENYRIYWDGDLLEELTDHTGFSTSTGVGRGQITKFNGYGNISALLTADAYSCNYTKGTPCLQADLFGDWREEVIWWRPDSMALRIYTTPISTTRRIYTLMHDHQYRQAICWQMCGYNQPPHTSFYLGNDFPTPIPAKSTNGKLVWKGSSSVWDLATSNWNDGDDAVDLIAGTSPNTIFSNGKEVLFDDHSTNYNVQISGVLEPSVVTVSSLHNYKIGGTGTLSGTMKFDKMGDSTLVVTGNHTYSGNTDVWEGNLWMNGTLSSSSVIVRRHANYGGNGNSGNGISTEYNAGIYVGGINNADTMKVTGNLIIANGAKLIFDLSDNPTIRTYNQTSSGLKNDYLSVNGILQLMSGSIVNISQTADSLSEGKYLLAKVNSLVGDLTKVKVTGVVGFSAELNFDAPTNSLYLVVKGVRATSSIKWTGSVNNTWDVAKTTNWDNSGYADVFVNGDTVTFDDTTIKTLVNIPDSVTVGAINVNSVQNYTISGVAGMKGKTSLYKTGTGTLSIINRNNISGKVTIDQGSLIMTYAPSATNFGGIGTNITDPAYFTVKDSAIIQVTTANEITTRGLTVAGNAGGVINVASTLYWDGVIQGTTLTKTGASTLYLAGNNANLEQTILKSGTINIYKTAAVANGVGKKLVFNGGTLQTFNSSGTYLTSSHNIEVPDGYTGTFVAAPRCEYNGALTGAGTLNWSCDFIRAYINGNWSAFTGKLNISANGANSTYENHFIVNNSNGFPNATVNLASGVKMCYKSGTDDNGRTKIKIGLLTGVSGAIFYNADLEVGNNNLSGVYSGEISGATAVAKVGTGSWSINGTNSYTGITTVSGGTLNVLSNITGTGALVINKDATVNIKNGVSVAGAIVVNEDGVLALLGTANSTVTSRGVIMGIGTVNGNASLLDSCVVQPGAMSFGTLTFASNVTMSSGAKLDLQVGGGTTSCDKLNISGTITCNGILNISLSSGTFKLDDSYQIIKAGTITGTFSKINLPQLSNGMSWDLTDLYTLGIIRIKNGTGISYNTLKVGVGQNPSHGLFRIFIEDNYSELLVQVTDLTGRVIYNTKIQNANSEFKIDLTNYPDGTYLLSIKAHNENSSLLKLIKKK